MAAEAAGFETVCQCEWADFPYSILEARWPDVPRFRDIRTFTKEAFFEKTGLETVTVLSGTSVPIGGSSTNAVIAGHRGWGGAAYFRYITELAIGDEVIITNLWERLRYQVVGTKIIEPHEIENIFIQPGRDMVTLLTCHPYASGGKQRYLVYCQRIPEYDIMEVPYD